MSPEVSLPSLVEIAAVAVRYKRFLALSFLVPVAGSIALAHAITPKYEADARLLVRVGREYMAQSEVAGSANSSPSTSMREAVDTEVQILTSQDLVRDVVRAITAEKLYPELAAAAPQHVLLEHAAAEALLRDLSVAPMKLTNVIEVGLRNPNHTMAEEALRVLIGRFQELHSQAFSRSRSPILEQQLHENEALLGALQRERAEYKVARGIFSVAEQRSQLVLQRSKNLNELREAERRKISVELQLRAVEFELAQEPATITLQTTSQESPVAEDTQKRLRDLEGRRQELLSQGHGPASPLLAGVSAELASVRQTMRQTRQRSVGVVTGVNPVATGLKTQLAALGTELSPLASAVSALRQTVDADDALLRQLAQNEVRLLDYDRRVADLDAATTLLRQRLADAHYIEYLDRAQVASLPVVQSPVASNKPVWPNKLLIGAAGVVTGMVATAFSLLVALTFGNHCLTVETVERLLGTPVLAVLPRATLPWASRLERRT